MTIEFDLSNDDVRAYLQRGYRNVLLIGAVPVFVVAAILVAGGADRTAFALLVLLPLAVMWTVWTIAFRWGMLRRSWKTSGPQTTNGLGHCRLVLDDNGIGMTTPFASSRHEWAAIGRFWETRTHYFVALLPSGYHIVPKRAFALTADAASFKEAVQRGARAG